MLKRRLSMYAFYKKLKICRAINRVRTEDIDDIGTASYLSVPRRFCSKGTIYYVFNELYKNKKPKSSTCIIYIYESVDVHMYTCSVDYYLQVRIFFVFRI